MVGLDFFGFLSLGECLLVGSNEKILQVGDLNLIFSLILKSSGGIVDTSCGNNGFRFNLGAFAFVSFEFLEILIFLLLNSSEDFFFD
jgi:hypothetical protein